VALARSDLLTWRGKLALVREPFAPAAGASDESVEDFAARRLGPEAARAIIGPFVTGVFAADARDISLEAGFPRLAALDRAGGLVRGVTKRTLGQLAGRIAGRRASSTPRGLWSPAGGLGTLVDALARTLGPRVRTRTEVHEIVATSDGVTIGGERWDGAVLAIPARAAAELVDDTLAARLRGFVRAPVAIVYLGVPGPIAQDGFGLLVARGEALRVLGIVFESTVWPDRAPEGHALLRCIFGGARDPDAVGLPDDRLVELARVDAGTALGVQLAPVHARVVRWPEGISQYRIGHGDRVRAAVAAARSRRIALAGADYRGPGLNDLCADADVIVAEVRTWG
jgi:oxygen-dependent protoporphyrinogen oxidase